MSLFVLSVLNVVLVQDLDLELGHGALEEQLLRFKSVFQVVVAHIVSSLGFFDEFQVIFDYALM